MMKQVYLSMALAFMATLTWGQETYLSGGGDLNPDLKAPGKAI